MCDHDHRIELCGRDRKGYRFARFLENHRSRIIGVRGKAGYGFYPAWELPAQGDTERGKFVLAVEVDEMSDGFASRGPIEEFHYRGKRGLGGDGQAVRQGVDYGFINLPVVFGQHPLGGRHALASRQVGARLGVLVVGRRSRSPRVGTDNFRDVNDAALAFGPRREQWVCAPPFPPLVVLPGVAG